MQCEQAQEYFSDYIERSLEPPLAVKLEAHFRLCDGCRRDLAALRETMAALSALPQVVPPPEGEWQLLNALRRLRAEEYEARRRRAPTFVERLRAIHPLSAAMSAGLATLVIAGSWILSSPWHTQLGLNPIRSQNRDPRPRITMATMPAIGVAYGAASELGREVQLSIMPTADIADAQVAVVVDGLNETWGGRGRISPALPARLSVRLPLGVEAATLRVEVASPSRGITSRQVVVVPLAGGSGGAVPLSFFDQPLEAALRHLAPLASRPIVCDAPAQEKVTLPAGERSVQQALEVLADQVRCRLRVEHGVYRLVAQP